MAIIPHLIARYALVLYVLAALGAFFYIWTALRARRQGGQALFAMERDDAVKQGMRSWLMASACVLLAVGVYVISNFVAPNLPLEEADETPVIAILFTPTVYPTSVPTQTLTPSLPTPTLGAVATVAPIATPLSRPPDTPTPAPTSEEEQPGVAACTSAGTQIISPGNGDRLSGVVEVKGTASLPDFAFYKFEIQWPDSQEWVTLQSFETPVVGGMLGTWDTRPLAGQPGTYKFRLVVVDQTGNFPAPCVISVVIDPSASEG